MMHRGIEAEPSIFVAMSMHGSVSIFRWMGILQDYDQDKEYNSGGKNQLLAAALLLVVRIKFLKPR